MNYVVVDLEWNQCDEFQILRMKSAVHLGGEIIEIGAVKPTEDSFLVRSLRST